MAELRARVFDGLKFMWDGESYASREDAEKKKAEYEADNFTVRIVEEDGAIEVYTRRVVSEVLVE